MKDIQYAGIILVVFFVVVALKLRFPAALNTISLLSRPGATVLLLGGVALVFYKGYHITALITAVLVVFLLQTVWSVWPHSDEKRLNLEIGRDLARFDESNSIDLQFANGSVKHNAPFLLAPPNGFHELLVFPPSSETLNEMCGN
jgi:hypothetical protein